MHGPWASDRNPSIMLWTHVVVTQLITPEAYCVPGPVLNVEPNGYDPCTQDLTEFGSTKTPINPQNKNTVIENSKVLLLSVVGEQNLPFQDVSLAWALLRPENNQGPKHSGRNFDRLLYCL